MRYIGDIRLVLVVVFFKFHMLPARGRCFRSCAPSFQLYGGHSSPSLLLLFFSFCKLFSLLQLLYPHGKWVFFIVLTPLGRYKKMLAGLRSQICRNRNDTGAKIINEY